MKEIVFLLEEQSCLEMVKSVSSRIVPSDVPVRFIPFEGKQDLEKNVTRKLKVYLNNDAFFIIIRDQDSAECVEVKNELLCKCQQSGKKNFKVRIMCHELETVFLADLSAVEKGLNLKGLSNNQQKAKFRSPDKLTNPKQVLKQITGNRYHEIAGSKAISPFLDLQNERSSSFKNLLSAMKEAVVC